MFAWAKAGLPTAHLPQVSSQELHALQPDARWVVMDMSGVNDMDAVAVSILEDLMAQARHRGVRFAFAGMKAQVRDVAVRAGWHERLESAMEYPSLVAAVQDLSGEGLERRFEQGGLA